MLSYSKYSLLSYLEVGLNLGLPGDFTQTNILSTTPCVLTGFMVQWIKCWSESALEWNHPEFNPIDRLDNKEYFIIIMSCRQHGYSWPSLATPPYRSSLPAGPQGYISYPNRAAVCRFELVVLLLFGHMTGSIGEHHLWARLCFSSMSGSSNFDSFHDGR